MHKYISHFNIYSDFKMMRNVVNEILIGLKKIIFNESILFEIKVILNELIINAMVHGNNMNEDKKVNLYIELYGQSLKIEVRDEGKNFLYKWKDYNYKNMKSSGRGLYIVGKLSDNLDISENAIIITKKVV